MQLILDAVYELYDVQYMIIDAKFILKLSMNVIKIEQQNKDNKKCDLHKNGVQL